MATPVLYHIEISHYNEKARWALDFKHVPHRRRAPMPMMHMAWAVAMTRGKQMTFPVLRMNGTAIGDSTRIIEYLEREYPDPPLYPADSEERQRALALEEFFDEELGPHIRRVVFHDALEAGISLGWVVPNAGRITRGVMRAADPIAGPALRSRYGISQATADVGREKTKAALDRIAAEVQPSGYLVGDRFSVADLTAAALSMPLVRPPEAPTLVPGPLPETYARFRDSLASHPGFHWVQEMYRRHRGSSSEIA